MLTIIRETEERVSGGHILLEVECECKARFNIQKRRANKQLSCAACAGLRMKNLRGIKLINAEDKIKELEAKISELGGDKVIMFHENIELKAKLAEADYQIQQQRLLNPISFNMLESITVLSEKLKIASEALADVRRMLNGHNIMCAIDEIDEALLKIKAVKELNV